MIATACVTVAAPASGQAVTVLSTADTTIRVERGKTTLLQLGFDLARVSVSDETIANFFDPSPSFPRELQVRGLQIGATNLIVWPLGGGRPAIFDIEVTADATALETQLRTLFPTTNISVSTSGGAVILSGTVQNPTIARRAAVLAEQTGAQVINNLQAPSGEQILLQVRFAEVRRTAGSNLGSDLVANNVGELDQIFGQGSTASIETLSEGLMRLFLVGQNADLDATIRALKSKGEYRSLAEPNLVTMEGQEASFLAGGEFPYPTIQQTGGGQNGTGQVTIQFKEFGIRLRFVPTVTNSGTVVLDVEPEVSSLDFANGLTFAGYQIPSLLTRRAKSTVELQPGQHLAIAGLLDNVLSDNVTKIPFLGDLPVLGALFRSRNNDQARTELLVLVTPHLVEASDVAPGMPTGEPRTWRWDRNMKVDTTRDAMPVRRRSGGD
jgi:pilus assembly protein CpaC